VASIPSVVGQTPLVLERVKAGPHVLEARREGFEVRSKRIEIEAGKEKNVVFDLRRR
jgi:hypothetical protein